MEVALEFAVLHNCSAMRNVIQRVKMTSPAVSSQLLSLSILAWVTALAELWRGLVCTPFVVIKPGNAVIVFTEVNLWK